MSDNSALRNIPQVEKLLQDGRLAPYAEVLGRSVLADVVRSETERFRESLRAGSAGDADTLIASIKCRCDSLRLEKIQRVINGTGVIIHTNFGRSPLSKDILSRLAKELSGYCNLEYYIPEKTRGRRGGYAEKLMCGLTGAEDALIVNNNAAAVFLLLKEFAEGRRVVISRSELVQIGGGFRIPDIMRQSGAILAEVGTTNITTLDDYRREIDSDTAMLLSVHQSNFVMKGFTAIPSLRELASLKTGDTLLVRDLGSGNLVSGDGIPHPFEPTITWELAQGPDLVCFSGDKLLGAGQAGIIVGRGDLIARLRKNPLMRILRVDKISYFILQEALLAYVNGTDEELPVWKMIRQSKADINRRISRFMKKLSPAARGFLSTADTKSTFGGGAMPAVGIGSRGVRIEVPGLSPDDIHHRLITGPVPVAGIIADDVFILDFRTVADGDLTDLVPAVEALAAAPEGPCS